MLGSLWAGHRDKNIHRYMTSSSRDRQSTSRPPNYLCVITASFFFSSPFSHQKESPNINLRRFHPILIIRCFYLPFIRERKSSGITWFTFFFFFFNFLEENTFTSPKTTESFELTKTIQVPSSKFF